MPQVYNKIVLDVKKKSNDIITAVQKDAKSRFLDVVLTDGAVPINLAGHEVRIYGKKYDGTELYNDGVITDATKGRCQFELTAQALAIANDLQVNVVIFKENTQILSTPIFTIHVVKSLFSDSAIESSNEYGALVVLYQNLHEAYELMTEMVTKIGVPMSNAQALKLDTMFKVWDYLIQYLKDNSAAGAVNGINTVNGKVGNSGDTTALTLFGKLNEGLNRGVVKSVQRGNIDSVELSEQIPYADVTVSSVNINKSILSASATGRYNAGEEQSPRYEIINSTTLRFYLTAQLYPAPPRIEMLSWQLTEYY